MIEHVHIVAEEVLRCNEGDYLSPSDISIVRMQSN